MSNYYINKNQQNNGDYEVHELNNCPHPASSENQVALGVHEDCCSAVRKAKKYNPTLSINGCYWCCNHCHIT